MPRAMHIFKTHTIYYIFANNFALILVIALLKFVRQQFSHIPRDIDTILAQNREI